MDFWKRVNDDLEIALGIFGSIVLLFGVGSLIWAAICALPEFLIAIGITGGCLLGFVATYLIAIIVTLFSDKNRYEDDLYEDRDYEDDNTDE